jgi:hypothetical protein
MVRRSAQCTALPLSIALGKSCGTFRFGYFRRRALSSPVGECDQPARAAGAGADPGVR